MVIERANGTVVVTFSVTVRAMQLCISTTVESGFSVVIERANQTVNVTVLLTARATPLCISATVTQHFVL